MSDHEALVESARSALVLKYGSLWQAASAMRLEESGGRLLLAMRMRPVPALIASQVFVHTGIDLNKQDA